MALTLGIRPCSCVQLVLDHNCSHLRPRYVSGDSLLAGCGEALRARLVPAQAAAAAGSLQVQLLDNSKYEDLAKQGLPLSMQQLYSCLETKTAELKFAAGTPGTGTTFEKHSGKTTRFRLLLTVTRSGGAPLAVAPLVSDPFTVVTTRSRGAAKGLVPLPGEAASKLEGIGPQGADSLKALTAVAGQQVEPVHTVGQFHALHQWVAQGPPERLQQLLDTTRIKLYDYNRAADHVQQTVYLDFRPRVWWWQGQGRGLLFSWSQAETAPAAPLAWTVPPQQGAGQQQGLTCVLAPLDMPEFKADLQQAVPLAMQEWAAAGHGRWEVCWSDDADPLAQGWWAQGMPFYLLALPRGILHAAAATAAAAAAMDGPQAQAAAPAAAAAVAAPAAASAGVQASLPPVQQLELPAARATLQSPYQQPLVPPPSLHSQPLYVPQQLQQQGVGYEQQPEWQQLQQQTTGYEQQPRQQAMGHEQQQEWQRLPQQVQELQEKQQRLEQSQPPGLEYPMTFLLGLDTPSSPSETLMPASETDADFEIQQELLTEKSDVSSLMDQDLPFLQQQPRKRQKLQQQPGGEQAAAAGSDHTWVFSATPYTVTGPSDDVTGLEGGSVLGGQDWARGPSLDLDLAALHGDVTGLGGGSVPEGQDRALEGPVDDLEALIGGHSV
ncbi:hypothetical protein COO60DRAFT_1677643 [Scenedesmus sp. NREL 46B-D3]|nr:hypothetical protein COO60DRAFT_1677643 [Scenedesmus sp. NREL 46B-D3]